ncbi:MAG: sensor histidine kinase [Rhodobacter sp.]|nr:sensor histidine kinase [Rhodobacter sp.]
MTRTLSLRARLTAIILLPILAVATVVGLWQLNNARRTAADVFNRSLLSAALAVANDVAISGGDALSPRTRDILADTSGGLVFYHVYAPDGVIVAGYATPPVGIPRPEAEAASPAYFQASYLGRTVSGVRLQNQTQVDGFAGIFTTTVWQDNAVRTAFVRDLVARSMVTICGLIVSLALIVWFGVRLGLRPLLDLEHAIERRSSDELSPIQRPVPTEVEGIVRTLNRLFAQVSRSMTAQAEFISNAAHQLRNPIAGVLSLAEAVHSAPSADEAKRRSSDLLTAARETADLSQKLLLLERATSVSPTSAFQLIDLDATLPDWIGAYRKKKCGSGVRIELDLRNELGSLSCDPTMLREAIRNLLDNAIQHGGLDLTGITVCAEAAHDWLYLSVSDNGRGISPADLGSARERFRQIAPTSTSGLGLSIVEAIVEGHGGSLGMASLDPGLKVELRLPVR